MYVFLGTGDSLAQALPEGILQTLTNQRGSGTDQSEWRYQMGRWGHAWWSLLVLPPEPRLS